jgi:hypothetical protein
MFALPAPIAATLVNLTTFLFAFSEPPLNSREVYVAKTDERINTVQQSLPRIVGRYPMPVAVGRLVVNPYE